MQGSLYEKNIEALKGRYSNIVEYLSFDDDKKSPIPEEKDLTAGVQELYGKTVMCAQKGDKTYQLDSLYDREVLLDLWFDSLGSEWELSAKLLMYGLGNGMYAKKFLRSARSDCSIVIHEPSEKMLRASLENFNLTELFTDTRVRIVFWPLYSKNEEIKIFYEEIIEYKDLESHRIGIYANYPRLFPDDCFMYLAGVDGARDYAIANQTVHDRFGEDYNRNTFSNFKYFAQSYSYEDLIEKMPKGIPAIVVAAGPSLDKNINDLKAAQGKSVIISTDTALKPLALAGIKPDIGIIVDGKKDARYMSEESSRVVPLICTPRSGDTFLSLHKGMKFMTDNFCNHIRKFMDDEGVLFKPVSTGGSVANSCFGLAEAFGCSCIILVGQDLAYTGDRTHSKVTVRGEKETAVEDLEHVIMGVDINGDPIRTSLEFKMYKEWFEDRIKLHPERRVIDATEGGIRIEGTTLMTLKEAIEQECTKDFDFSEVLKGVGKLLDDDQKSRFIDYALNIPKQLDEMRRMIDTALSDYRSMRKLVEENRYHQPKFMKLYDESNSLSEKIDNSPVIEYVHNQLQDRVSKMLGEVNKLEKDERAELLAVCNLGEGYLKDMENAISELTPYINAMETDLGGM